MGTVSLELDRQFRNSLTSKRENSALLDEKKVVVVRYFTEHEEILTSPADIYRNYSIPREYNTFHIEELKDDEDEDIFTNNRRNNWCRTFNWGYVGVLACNTLHVLATVTARLLGVLFPLFEFNFLRSIFHIVIAIPAMMIYKEMPSTSCQDFLKVFAASLFYAVYMIMYFFATQYIPVGNLIATWVVSCLLVKGIHALCTKSCSVELLVSVFVAIIGLIVLAAPDFVFEEIKFDDGLLIPCPCVSYTIPTYSQITNITGSCTFANQTDHIRMHVPETCFDSQLNWNMEYYFNTENFKLELFNELWMGYVFAGVSGLCHSFCFAITEELRQYHHYSVLIFWLGSIGTVLSGFGFLLIEIPSFPLDAACVILALVHCFSVAADTTLSMGLYGSVREEGLVLMTGIFIVITFVCQTTFLISTLWWAWSGLNILGAILLMSGLLFLPISKLCTRNDK